MPGCGTGIGWQGQGAAQTPGAQVAYSQEAVVFEQVRSLLRFEDDGTGRRELYMRVRTQSEAGVQQYGQLVFGYNSANERADIACAFANLMGRSLRRHPSRCRI